MKNIFFLFSFCFLASQAVGQGQGGFDSTSGRVSYTKKKQRPPFALIGVSSGINNPSGMLGVDFEFPIKKYLVLGTGLGFSSWGNKSHFDCKYFIKRRQLGWAVTAGLAFNSGVYNFRARLHTVNNTRQEVTFNMNPVGTFYLGVARYFRCGKGPNRFFTTAGWNVPFSPPNYQIVYNGPGLADQSSRYIRFREPGGLMLGLGMLWGLHH